MSFRKILHIDMDCFYVAVERRENPDLNGKPVIVGGLKGHRGVISSASYEARKFGLKAGMAIHEASRRCPHGIFLPVRMNLYHEASEQIMSIFQEYSPLVEPVSVDEAFIDLTGTELMQGPAEKTARLIQTRIKEELKLTASCGLASTKLLAKIASDMKKPEGFVIIPPEKELEVMWALPVKVLWGVGERMNEALSRLNIKTVGELARMPIDMMEKMFGASGRHLHALANNQDDREVIPYTAPKSVGHETTFSFDQTNMEVLRTTFLGLTEKVSYRLRKQGVKGKTVTVKLRYSDFKTYTRQCLLDEPTDQTDLIFERVLVLWKTVPKSNLPVRLIGVSVSGFSDEIEQVSFLHEKVEKLTRLSAALDKLNEKYGKNTVQRSTLYRESKSIPSKKNVPPKSSNK